MVVPEPAASRELLPKEGGPTYRIEKRRELIRENSPRVVQRALVSICLTWLVLLALAAFQGFAVGHRVPVPFLRDIAVHARFLLAVPLLLLAENVVGPRLAHAAAHFITLGVVIRARLQPIRFGRRASPCIVRFDTGQAYLCRACLYRLRVNRLVDIRSHLFVVATSHRWGFVTYLGWMVADAVLHTAVSVFDPTLALDPVSMGAIPVADE